MDTAQFESFYSDYVRALRENRAAAFIGAGLSRGAGYADWRELLKDIAAELKLEIDKETDLIALAQFHLNTQMGQRGKLNQLIVDHFAKDAKLTDNHRLLAKLSIDTVWTTNYDKLIETAFKEAHKRVDVKRDPINIAHTLPGRVVTLYKMHGDVDEPHHAVLTKDDYETFSPKRDVYSIKLKGDLVERTFLFLGYSFNDPNIDYILSRIRGLINVNTRNHYCLMRWPEKPKKMSGQRKAQYEYERRRLELRVADLKRYNINALMVDRFEDVTNVLSELNKRSHLRDVFVSGSAHVYEPLGRARLEQLSYRIGEALIANGCNVVSGVGLGIGGHVVLGAINAVYGADDDLSHRLTLRPFPQAAPKGVTLKEFWTKYRADMIGNAGVCVFLSGNKDNAGVVQTANGVIEEFDIAVADGKYPIPVGATGHAARLLWEKVTASLDTYFPKGGIKGHFEILGKESSTDDQIVTAIIAILKQIKAI